MRLLRHTRGAIAIQTALVTLMGTTPLYVCFNILATALLLTHCETAVCQLTRLDTVACPHVIFILFTALGQVFFKRFQPLLWCPARPRSCSRWRVLHLTPVELRFTNFSLPSPVIGLLPRSSKRMNGYMDYCTDPLNGT